MNLPKDMINLIAYGCGDNRDPLAIRLTCKSLYADKGEPKYGSLKH
jgi:hypothetical protein